MAHRLDKRSSRSEDVRKQLSAPADVDAWEFYWIDLPPVTSDLRIFDVWFFGWSELPDELKLQILTYALTYEDSIGYKRFCSEILPVFSCLQRLREACTRSFLFGKHSVLEGIGRVGLEKGVAREIATTKY